jgi:adenylosuccinate lyase
MIPRYTRPEMARLWSDGHRFEAWLEVELRACEAMEELGAVPKGTAAKVRGAVKLDPQRILEIEETTRHDVIAFLTHVEETAGEAARWLHLGMTSSDVLDTSFALLLREAMDLILEGVDQLRAACERRAFEHRATPCMGRSHGMHAEPISLGLVFARWYAQLGRDRARLARARAAIAVGKISGAVGVYGNVSPEVEARALGRLGLEPETVATQVVARDRHAEYFGALAVLGATIEQMALTVRHWQRTEVGEAEEPFRQGQKGSSAMPHKKNPILSENLCGLARLLRTNALAAFEDVALWHERDISHSSTERVIGPDSTTLADFMLHRTTGLIDGLVVHPERARANLERSAGLVFSEGVMLALVRAGLGRQEAYGLVQRNALRSLAGEGWFRDLLAADVDVAAKLSPAAIDECFDLEHHLRYVDVIFARTFNPATREPA